MNHFKELLDSALHLYLFTQSLVSKLTLPAAHLLALQKSATFPLQPLEPGTEDNA